MNTHTICYTPTCIYCTRSAMRGSAPQGTLKWNSKTNKSRSVVVRVVQSSAASGMDSNRSNWLAVPLAHRGPPFPVHCRRPHVPPRGDDCHWAPPTQTGSGRMDVRCRSRRLQLCGVPSAVRRWGHQWEPRIWCDIDDARTVDGTSVPVWDGSECRAGRLGYVCRNGY